MSPSCPQMGKKKIKQNDTHNSKQYGEIFFRADNNNNNNIDEE